MSSYVLLYPYIRGLLGLPPIGRSGPSTRRIRSETFYAPRVVVVTELAGQPHRKPLAVAVKLSQQRAFRCRRPNTLSIAALLYKIMQCLFGLILPGFRTQNARGLSSRCERHSGRHDHKEPFPKTLHLRSSRRMYVGCQTFTSQRLRQMNFANCSLLYLSLIHISEPTRPY